MRQRTRAKNEVHATLVRCLLGRPPVSDLFGTAGRSWLAEHRLPAEEAETVAGCLRQIDFLDAEVNAIDAKLSEWAVDSPEAKRLMTIPGVGVAVAAALMAAIGDVSRFSSPRKLVAYLGLDAKVRQRGRHRPRILRFSSVIYRRPPQLLQTEVRSRSRLDFHPYLHGERVGSLRPAGDYRSDRLEREIALLSKQMERQLEYLTRRLEGEFALTREVARHERAASLRD